MEFQIAGGRVLQGNTLEETAMTVAEGVVSAFGPPSQDRSKTTLDVGGLLVLPGIVDIHGDAFERQIMPRPKVSFPLDIALRDTDRQMVSNGITTAFHGVTVSWEPGLRSLENTRAVVEAMARLRDVLSCDTRLHIRWETFALDAIEDVIQWLSANPSPILAFNDHTTETIEKQPGARSVEKDAARSGLSAQDYEAMLERVWERRADVPAAIEALAERARQNGCVLLAHDERSIEDRIRYRALGAVASEFPMTPETAKEARRAGEHTVLGAPNVIRGGSHKGMMNAAPAVADGLCTVLASDYYYPAPLLAAFKLVDDGILDLPSAWQLVSANAAEAAGLNDRGMLEPGRRADFIVVDDSDPAAPRVVSAFVAGTQVYAAGSQSAL